MKEEKNGLESLICTFHHRKAKERTTKSALHTLKNWQVRSVIIDFLLRKYSQNEVALKQEPTSLILLRRKDALIKLINLDLKKYGGMKG